MIIFASKKLDITTFTLLSSAAAAFDIQIERKAIAEPLALPEEKQKSFTAINRLDALFSVYKGIKKLKEFDDI